MNKNKLALAICCFGTLTLYGCGDSDGPAVVEDDTVITSENYTITAIDGYLTNAVIWLDINGNYSLDTGEPSGRSDENGKVDLDVTDVSDYEQYPVVVQIIAGETIDQDNPGVTLDENQMLSAPAGLAEVTPITTIVHALLTEKIAELGTTPTNEELDALLEEAVADFADLLGVDSEDVLGDFVENGSENVAFVARTILASNVLPSTTEEMENEMGSGLDTLLANIEGAAALIKAKVEEVNAGTGDFSTAEDVFDGTEDPDIDTDSDGVPDYLDAFEFDPLEWADSNGDGYGDNLFDDRDSDTILSHSDNCIDIANTDQLDTDSDNIGDACDTDKDGDSILNDADNCPLNANTNQSDIDGDGLGDECDLVNDDPDADGVLSDVDNCPVDANADQLNSDTDTEGDACDTDDDDDTVLDDVDNCPLTSNEEQLDEDGDGLGDLCDLVNDDPDTDGILSSLDNCPNEANADQSDLDNDGTGDACDTDKDGDNVLNDVDNCPLTSNIDQSDLDTDGTGDACDTDKDGDSVLNDVDNCPLTFNEEQLDQDGDGIGDDCDNVNDTDNDNDGVLNVDDNCPDDANTDQSDIDLDDIGDVCDTTTQAVWDNTNWNDSNWQ